MIHYEPSPGRLDSELTHASRGLLLEVARAALRIHFGKPSPSPTVDAESPLCKPGRAFVTLKKGGDLRGCIGNLEGALPLLQVVSECAVAAAARDPRFAPVEHRELGALHLTISVLGDFRPLRTPEEIVIGRHGLLLEKQRQRGILLPQVAVEMGLDATAFLELVCRKAALPTDAWKEGAAIQTFTAQVFSAPAL